MEQPILVVMAAGLGSRYGGLKQIDPLGPSGQIILDYSIYDAYRAGFRRVVFVIQPALEETFEQVIGKKARRFVDVSYAYQTLHHLPAGLAVSDERTKPLGTGHAIWCVREQIDAPFAVINADDFYGADAFAKMYTFLQQVQDDTKYRYCMVGYAIENTLTENGTVSRGVCRTDADGYLTEIVERTKIAREADGVIRYTDGTGGDIQEGTPVSMNLWGFTPSFLQELEVQLQAFFAGALQENPLRAEFYLPFAVDTLIEAGKATVQVLPTQEKWFGVTYQEDKIGVKQFLCQLMADGKYPADL